MKTEAFEDLLRQMVSLLPLLQSKKVRARVGLSWFDWAMYSVRRAGGGSLGTLPL